MKTPLTDFFYKHAAIAFGYHSRFYVYTESYYRKVSVYVPTYIVTCSEAGDEEYRVYFRTTDATDIHLIESHPFSDRQIVRITNVRLKVKDFHSYDSLAETFLNNVFISYNPIPLPQREELEFLVHMGMVSASTNIIYKMQIQWKDTVPTVAIPYKFIVTQMKWMPGKRF